METKDNRFPEQEAPEKNTDQAFVQVGKDGQPVMPATADEKAGNKEDNAVEDTQRK